MASKTLALCHAALVIAALGVPPLSAQCAKPPKPLGGGYPTTSTLDVTVTYSDGYKTMGDLFYPSSPAPSCGWPLLVINHEFGSDRKAGVFGQYYASHGFALWTYDIRGHGAGINLNPSTTGYRGGDGTEQADIAEEIAFVRQRFSSLVSQTKVGYYGTGVLGSAHALIAASFSGKKFTAPGRGTVQFPVIGAVAGPSFCGEQTADLVPDGTLFNLYFPLIAFAPLSQFRLIWEPALQAAMQQAWLTQDVATIYQDWKQTRFYLDGLRTTNVPIWLTTSRFFNAFVDSRTQLEAIASIPSNNPSQIGVGGLHSERGNNSLGQGSMAWFDRFLWGIQNAVENDARFRDELAPPDLDVIRDQLAVPPIRHDAQSPPADVTFARRYLTDQGALDQNAPAGAFTPTAIQNRVDPAYGPLAFLSAFSRSQVLAKIPLSERTFTMAPLAQDLEMAGQPKVSLRVVPQQARFQISAALTFRAPGSSQDLQFASRGVGFLDASPGIPMRIDMNLASVLASLPKGTIVKLVLRNHWLLDDPQLSGFGSGARTAPTFSDFDLAIRHGSAIEASTVDLPLRNPRVSMTASSVAEYLHQTRAVEFKLSGGASRGRSTYIVLASLSGHAPGISVPGGVLPVRFDAVTDVFLMNGSAFTVNFMGQLDAAGYAYSRLVTGFLMPLDPVLSGLRLSFAAWVTPNNFASGEASDPVDVILK